jgi:peptide-methionine (S)-S-oxide reductase
VGYAGGTTPDPTYHNIGDYTETVQVDYDPGRITYEQLLDVFWGSGYPQIGTMLNQYRAIIFYHNETQKTAAVASLEREENRLGRMVPTAVLPYTDFYPAEDYHQKYYLRANAGLFNEISQIYPVAKDLMNSTAAARLNGYLGGFGDVATVKAHIDEFGLSPAGQQELLQTIEHGLQPACPVP